MKHFDVVFDGPPGPTAGRFVEVENEDGRGFRIGEWIDRGNGLWALRIPDYSDVEKAARDLYDNRLGHAPGRSPYAPIEFWEALRKALELKGGDR